MAERKSEDISDRRPKRMLDDMTDTYARKIFGIYARNYVRIDAR